MKVAIIITAILLVAVTAGAAQPQQHEALAQPSSASSPSPATTNTTTTTMIEEGEELVSLSANDTSTQNVTSYTGTDINSVIFGQLFGSYVTEYDLYENGTAVATFTGGTHSGIEVHYNHSLTAENGYRYENGTIYSPDGRELRIVLQD